MRTCLSIASMLSVVFVCVWGFFSVHSLPQHCEFSKRYCLSLRICCKDKSSKLRGYLGMKKFLGMKSTFSHCVRGTTVRDFRLKQVRYLHASLHTCQELTVFRALLGLFLKSEVFLDCISRHFKKYYCKLTDSIVLYCNHQIIMDVLCLRILIWNV